MIDDGSYVLQQPGDYIELNGFRVTLHPVGRTFHPLPENQSWVEVPEHYHVEFTDGGYYLEYREPYRDLPLFWLNAACLACLAIGSVTIIATFTWMALGGLK